MKYHATCPECKNDIDLEQDSLAEGDHFECPTCGISLQANNIQQGDDDTQEIQDPEIVEEEK